MSKVKQVIVVRKDLNMRKGKIAAQVAHASMGVFFGMMERTHNDIVTEYALIVKQDSPLDLWLDHREAFAKIVVSCDSEQELLGLVPKAFEAGLPYYLVTDKGLTEFHGVPTPTCIAIGPDWSEKIDELTKEYKLL